MEGVLIKKQKERKENMSKKIIAGALGVMTIVGSFAILAVPTFAAQTSWHQVTVTPGQELVLGGNTSSNTTLTPTITTPASSAAGAMSVQSTVAWKIQWLAVTGEYTDAATGAALGTNLGTSGFTDTGGYAYAGSQAAATTGDAWGVVLAIAGTGASLATTPTLDIVMSDAATGSATSTATLTPTYSASTTGSLGNVKHYGTIYYYLSAQ